MPNRSRPFAADAWKNHKRPRFHKSEIGIPSLVCTRDNRAAPMLESLDFERRYRAAHERVLIVERVR
jgi:hypothetical protein